MWDEVKKSESVCGISSLHLIFLIKNFFFYWSVVDLQCCVSGIQVCVSGIQQSYTYTCIHSSLDCFPIEIITSSPCFN